ncbi:hypothetical protein GCM10009753_65730 [Streptantibioticus ferralitis]
MPVWGAVRSAAPGCEVRAFAVVAGRDSSTFRCARLGCGRFGGAGLRRGGARRRGGKELVSPKDGRVKIWHLVRVGETTARCRRDLEPEAAAQSSDGCGRPEADPFRHSCGALYPREAP